MHKIKIQALIPLLDRKYRTDNFVDIKRNGLNDFVKHLSLLELTKIEKVEIDSQIVNDITSTYKTHLDEYSKSSQEFIEVVINGSYSMKKALNEIEDKQVVINDKTPEEVAKYVLQIGIVDELAAKLTELSIFSLISCPVALSVRDTIILLDDRYYCKIDSVNNPLEDVYLDSVKMEFPLIENLKLEEVLKNIKNINVEFRAEPKCALEKALNCLTYILRRTDSQFDSLFYVIMGLEAIYVKGESGIQGQLNEKIQLYLGELKTHKKAIKAMYNCRSKLLHGENVMQPFHYVSSNYYQYNKLEEDNYKSNNFALGILISTIQKMIKTKRRNLNFKYSLIT